MDRSAGCARFNLFAEFDVIANRPRPVNSDVGRLRLTRDEREEIEMDKNDKLIILIKALREEMRYKQGDPIFIEYPVLALELGLDVDTVKDLLPDAAKTVGLEISQQGQDSAMLTPIPRSGVPIVRG